MNPKIRLFLLVFFLANLLLSSFHTDLWHNVNATSRALPVITYFENGSFCIDRYHEKTGDKSYINGHYYTDKAPLPTLIVLPVFGLLQSMGIVETQGDSLYGNAVFLIGDFLCGTLPFVLILFLTFLFIYKKATAFSPVLLAMLPLYASFMFVFSGTFYNHLFSGILLLGAYLCIKDKRFLLAGLFAGMSFLSEYTLAVFFPFWAIQIWFNEKKVLKSVWFVAGILPSIIFILVYNYLFTGNAFDMLYKYVMDDYVAMKTGYGFNLPQIKALWGLTFSQYRGMFFYSPFLFMVLYYALRCSKETGQKKFLSHYLAIPCVAYILFVSSYFMWWGGWSYGPRHLTAVAVLLTFSGGYYISTHRFNKPLFWSLITFGFISAILAKSTVQYSIPTEVESPLFQKILPEFLAFRLNSNNLLSIWFDIDPAYALVIWLALFAGITFGLKKWFDKINIPAH